VNVCMSAVARLLRLWVLRAWMSVFVSVVCCQVEVSVKSLLMVQGNPTDCGVSSI
jgi:hypothetical protein